MDFSVRELIENSGGNLAAYVQKLQCAEVGVDLTQVRKKMFTQLKTMKESVREGLNADLRSLSGLSGGQAKKLYDFSEAALLKGASAKACAYALAVAECNACMGKIVAAPTAGACGILPGCLLGIQETEGFNDEKLVDALFVAAAFGHVIALSASISGAEGGCQAECGSAAAMAAAAMVHLRNGSPAQSADACAFALMNTMGLVCDPVGGLVEVPCVYRNVGGVGNAFTAADMALAGIVCPIPCDEVISAMKDVGDALPLSLRETGDGGCAACPSMRKKFK